MRRSRTRGSMRVARRRFLHGDRIGDGRVVDEHPAVLDDRAGERCGLVARRGGQQRIAGGDLARRRSSVDLDRPRRGRRSRRSVGRRRPARRRAVDSADGGSTGSGSTGSGSTTGSARLDDWPRRACPRAVVQSDAAAVGCAVVRFGGGSTSGAGAGRGAIAGLPEISSSTSGLVRSIRCSVARVGVVGGERPQQLVEHLGRRAHPARAGRLACSRRPPRPAASTNPTSRISLRNR